jgi:hypothetical protein
VPSDPCSGFGDDATKASGVDFGSEGALAADMFFFFVIVAFAAVNWAIVAVRGHSKEAKHFN